MAETRARDLADVGGDATGLATDAELTSGLASKLDIAGGKILQIVRATHATAVNTTSGSYVTTNLTATITPTSASNKVLVLASNPMRISTANQSVDVRIFRGTVAGTAVGPHITLESAGGAINAGVTITVLDSPATTSAQAYTMGFAVSGGTGTAQLGNRPSEIILCEVSA